MLFLKVVRPSGKIEKLEVECHEDCNGILMFVTGRRIIRWINEQLKITEAENSGIVYSPDTEAEFPPIRSWKVGRKD